jgi:phospholipid transport system substrate-binding protein
VPQAEVAMQFACFKVLPALLASFLVLATLPAARAAETPSATVERLNAALLEAMRNAEALGYQGRYEKLAPVVRQTFDFAAMARVILGGHWSSISAEQQRAFTEAFADYSVGVFADRFDGYSGERFEVLGEEPARRGTVLVRNQIVKSDGEAVAINYLTRPEDDGSGWRIIDTILGGTASELATRRAEYDGIIERQGIDALTQALKDRTSGFAR